MSEEWPLEPIGTVKWWPCTGDDDLIGSECGYIVYAFRSKIVSEIRYKPTDLAYPSSVPKDHLEPLAGTAKIALGRFKAETEHSKGTVLFHPGEIGSRGKSFVTEHAHLLWHQLGNEYDIVGFDSRGTGESQPKIQCFNNRVAGQEYTNKPFYAHATFLYNTVLDRGYDFPLNITKNKLRQILLPQQRVVDAMQKTQHQVCYRIMGDDLKHMGTTNVVRDLDAITTALDGEDAPMYVHVINFELIRV
ncbi:hypothetical protein EUX98_g6976 [Antrodiella citrinella]|uniref:Uncharacterized protein n=1 Tax=Antrodiella citrinella TaxID=2447956 RepID=A0A4S4MMP9_9APHY|nr:hypothetical protein EUX98_g6976 [Antrodiella citrinella]